MKRYAYLTVALFLCLGMTAAAEARMRGGRMHTGDEMGHTAHYLAALDLTEAQQEAFLDSYRKLHKEVIRKRADMAVAEVELREFLDQEPIDLKAAETKIRQIATLQADVRLMHVKAAEALRATLTPEQQAKYDTLDPAPFMGGGMMGQQMGGMGPHGGMMGSGGGMMGSGGGCPMMRGMQHGAASPNPAPEAKKTDSSAHSGHQLH
jgi:Spy/CpxP family protein refolding chaperone